MVRDLNSNSWWNVDSILKQDYSVISLIQVQSVFKHPHVSGKCKARLIKIFGRQKNICHILKNWWCWVDDGNVSNDPKCLVEMLLLESRTTTDACVSSGQYFMFKDGNNHSRGVLVDFAIIELTRKHLSLITITLLQYSSMWILN